jgi:hypothetical protein
MLGATQAALNRARRRRINIRGLGDLNDDLATIEGDVSDFSDSLGTTELSTPLLYAGLAVLGLVLLMGAANKVGSSVSGFGRRRRARKRAKIRAKYESKLAAV